MSQTTVSLYPKISSIYNKIMQLVIAIALIVILMNIWVSNVNKDEQVLDQHFYLVGDQFIHQASLGLKVFIEKNDREGVQQFLNNLATEPFIESIYLYDPTGQIRAQAGNQSSVKTLYGIEPNTRNASKAKVPFISEIRAEQSMGYVRININRSAIVDNLKLENQEQQQLVRIMLIVAGLAGFFLTRGLSRFSRQGFRVAPTK